MPVNPWESWQQQGCAPGSCPGWTPCPPTRGQWSDLSQSHRAWQAPGHEARLRGEHKVLFYRWGNWASEWSKPAHGAAWGQSLPVIQVVLKPGSSTNLSICALWHTKRMKTSLDQSQQSPCSINVLLRFWAGLPASHRRSTQGVNFPGAHISNFSS